MKTVYPPIDLEAFDVDPTRGFLPPQDPITSLPEPFAEWDRLARDLPALLLTGQVRTALETLKTPDLTILETTPQLERSMLIISAFGMSYVWGVEPPITRLPAAIAVPWVHIAERLGRPPIIAHASLVLQNWRRVDPSLPITADNLACIQHFLGGMDEQWFYTVTTALEAAGAPALPLLVEAKQAISSNDTAHIINALRQIEPILRKVLAVLMRMYEKCAPSIFFLRVRPYLAGWETDGLIFEGVSDTPLKLHGGSAAQSSLIQAYDAGLGITHTRPETRPFLTLMRDYMPPRHRQFLGALEAGPQLYDFVKSHQQEMPTLGDAYNSCILALDEIRKAHMEIAVRYIIQQSPEGEKGGLGTGGTSFVPFLSEARKETKERLV